MATHCNRPGIRIAGSLGKGDYYVVMYVDLAGGLPLRLAWIAASGPYVSGVATKAVGHAGDRDERVVKGFNMVWSPAHPKRRGETGTGAVFLADLAG